MFQEHEATIVAGKLDKHQKDFIYMYIFTYIYLPSLPCFFYSQCRFQFKNQHKTNLHPSGHI